MILRGFFYIIILPSIILKSAHVLKFPLLHHPHRDYHRDHTNDPPHDHTDSKNSFDVSKSYTIGQTLGVNIQLVIQRAIMASSYVNIKLIIIIA